MITINPGRFPAARRQLWAQPQGWHFALQHTGATRARHTHAATRRAGVDLGAALDLVLVTGW